MMRAIMTKTLFVFLILLSAQALAFEVGGFSYTVIGATTNVEVTGRASDNTATEIVIPATTLDGTTTYNVTTIGASAFFRNDLTSVIIPDSVTTIGDSAFNGNALASVIIGDSVTTIGRLAFFTNLLPSVTIPDSVTSIGDFTFGGNALISVTFLGDFGTFNLKMFEENPDLETITYCQGAKGWPTTFTPAGTVSVTATEVECAAPAPAGTPVPVSPLWLLGIMAGLLSLVAVRKLRKA